MPIQGSQLDLQALILASVSKSANYTATEDDATILVDATAGVRTISLPPAASVQGIIYTIVKIDSSSNVVTIDPDGSELIKGVSSFSLAVQWKAAHIQSDGTGWIVLAETIIGLITVTGVEFSRQPANPGGIDVLYIDDGSNYLAGSLVIGGPVNALGVGIAPPADEGSLSAKGGLSWDAVTGTFTLDSASTGVAFHLISALDRPVRIQSTDPTSLITFDDSNSTSETYVGVGAAGDVLVLRAGNATRASLTAAGRLQVLGNGIGAGLKLGSDVNLYRKAANVLGLWIGDSLEIDSGDLTVNGDVDAKGLILGEQTFSLGASATDSIVDADGAMVTVTTTGAKAIISLPAAPSAGRSFWVHLMHDSTHPVALDPGVKLLDGSTTDINLSIKETAFVYYDGTEWTTR